MENIKPWLSVAQHLHKWSAPLVSFINTEQGWEIGRDKHPGMCAGAEPPTKCEEAFTNTKKKKKVKYKNKLMLYRPWEKTFQQSTKM